MARIESRPQPYREHVDHDERKSKQDESDVGNQSTGRDKEYMGARHDSSVLRETGPIHAVKD